MKRVSWTSLRFKPNPDYEGPEVHEIPVRLSCCGTLLHTYRPFGIAPKTAIIEGDDGEQHIVKFSRIDPELDPNVAWCKSRGWIRRSAICPQVCINKECKSCTTYLKNLLSSSPKHNEMETELAKDIAAVLNKHSAENGSDTPDFILAEYLMNCLQELWLKAVSTIIKCSHKKTDMKEVIVCAAIKVQNYHSNVDGVYCGTRHNFCIAQIVRAFKLHNRYKIWRLFGNKYMMQKYLPIKQNWTQGFVTSSNRFVDRFEALEIARENGRVNNVTLGDQLISEDLY